MIRIIDSDKLEKRLVDQLNDGTASELRRLIGMSTFDLEKIPMTIIQYRDPVSGQDVKIIAMSEDAHYIEVAIHRAKECIAERGAAAYDKFHEEKRTGIKHDPGQYIKGFPHDWREIYIEQLAFTGIRAVCYPVMICETDPFEEFNKMRGKK